MFGRYVACLPPGFAVTAALLLMMQHLVDARLELSPARSGTPVILRTVELPPPPPPTAIPTPPTRIRPPAPTPDGGIPVSPDPEPAPPDTRGRPLQPPTGFGSEPDLLPGDGPLVCIVRVRPQYPPAAEARGIEGLVTVVFDVLADGRVANAQVAASSDPVFHKAAIRAAERFRFRPRVVDGQPVATQGVQTSFRFEMDDAGQPR